MRKSLLCFLLIQAGPAQAQTPAPQTPRIGECFDVRGKVYLSSNSGLVLDTDTARFFLSGRSDCLPDVVQQPMDRNFRAIVAGTYKVCREPDSANQFGVMHVVCIKAAYGLSSR